MDTSNIISNNEQIFSAINYAQNKTSQTNEKIARLNIKTKIQEDKNEILGKMIDILV